MEGSGSVHWLLCYVCNMMGLFFSILTALGDLDHAVPAALPQRDRQRRSRERRSVVHQPRARRRRQARWRSSSWKRRQWPERRQHAAAGPTPNPSACRHTSPATTPSSRWPAAGRDDVVTLSFTTLFMSTGDNRNRVRFSISYTFPTALTKKRKSEEEKRFLTRKKRWKLTNFIKIVCHQQMSCYVMTTMFQRV